MNTNTDDFNSSNPDGMLAYYMAINNPSRDDPNWPLPSFDARDWAEAFMQKVKNNPNFVNYDNMLGWFANSLMRGHDEGLMRMSEKLEAKTA